MILTRSNHPLAFTVKRDSGDVAGMTLEGDDWIRMSAVDVIEADVLVAGCCEILFVWRDA
jgi:hypothetical protein